MLLCLQRAMQCYPSWPPTFHAAGGFHEPIPCVRWLVFVAMGITATARGCDATLRRQRGMEVAAVVVVVLPRTPTHLLLVGVEPIGHVRWWNTHRGCQRCRTVFASNPCNIKNKVWTYVFSFIVIENPEDAQWAAAFTNWYFLSIQISCNIPNAIFIQLILTKSNKGEFHL